MKKTLVYLLLAALCIGSLEACGDSPASPSAVPSETVESTPTDTPTLTPTATPTAVPTETPVPTEAAFEVRDVRVAKYEVTPKTGAGEEYADSDKTIYVGTIERLWDAKEVDGVIWYDTSDGWIKADDDNLLGDAWTDALMASNSFICGANLIAQDDSYLIYTWNGGGGYGYVIQSKADPTDIKGTYEGNFPSNEYNTGYLYLCYLAAGRVPYEIKDTDLEKGKDASITNTELAGEYCSDADKCIITIYDNATNITLGEIKFEGADESYDLRRGSGNTIYWGYHDSEGTLWFSKDDNGNLYFWTDWYVDGEWTVETFYKK